MQFKQVILRWFYYRIIRYKIKHIQWINKQRRIKLSEHQIFAIDIFKKAITDSDSILLVDRLTDTSYIHIPNKKLFLKLEFKELTITNSKYNYYIPIPEYEYKMLIHLFDKKLNRVRTQWENSIIEKTSLSLNKLLKELNKN